LQAALAEIEVAEVAELERGISNNDLTRLQEMKGRVVWKLERLKPKDPTSQCWEHINHGKQLLDHGDITQALQQYDRALEVAETIGDLKLRSIAHQSRARLLGRSQEKEFKLKALRDWTKAELLEYECEKSDADEISRLLTKKGNLLLELGNRDWARRVAEAALTYKPDSSSARNLLHRTQPRKDYNTQLTVGSKGKIKKIISKKDENKYFGFIVLDQPYTEKDVFFHRSSLECDWDDLREGDFVMVDWFIQPDGRWAANRVILID
jgi:cold shock CspA family protein/flagellar biosynthesis/type III secretory pathway chaperone